MTSRLLSGRVKKVSPSSVSTDRYEFISLQETEPDLGVPGQTGYVLVSDAAGVRSWVSTDSLVGITVSGNTSTFSGQISHEGLIFTDGTNVDQLKTFTKSLQLNGDWIDVGIAGTDIETGSYMLQLFANDTAVNGQNSNEYYSGIVSWYSGQTNSSATPPTDEIVLHRAGGSSEGKLYLRTYRTNSPATEKLKLQMYSSNSTTGAANYVFKFRRMI